MEELSECCCRVTFADLVAMSSSVLSAIQIPDPTETGLFNRPPRPRQRQYQMLSGEYTWVVFIFVVKIQQG